MVFLDIWNYDRFWMNQIYGIILVGSYSFTWSFAKMYKMRIHKMEKVLNEEKKKKKLTGCCMVLGIIGNKFKVFFLQYGKAITEVIDFSKDIYYCYIVSHVSQTLTILLWMFALYAFTFLFLNTMTMTKGEYIDCFGMKDIERIEDKKYWYLRFTIVKFRRSLKENFLYLDDNEIKNEENLKRLNRNQFFIAMFENLPQILL